MMSKSEMPAVKDLQQKPGLLLVGSFLSRTLGVRSVSEDLAQQLTTSGYPVWLTSQRTSRFARLLDMLISIWRHRRQYDLALVEVFSGLAFVWAEISCWLLNRLGKLYILTLHGGNLPQFALRWPGRIHRLLASASCITVPSPYLLEKMRPYAPDLRLLPNPLEIQKYPFRLREAPLPRLIWLRAFHQVYNPGLAPQVLSLLLDLFPSASLIMVGPDKGDGSLQETKQIASGLGVMDRLTLPGAVAKDQVPTWLNKGDIFLNTTNFDNTPVSVLEAMACGLCVVSTQVGGLPYLLEHEKDSLLVPANDPAAMSSAVRRLLGTPNLSVSISQNARLKAEGLDWGTVFPLWQDLITEVNEQTRA
ncbi:glycosyltransferase family 4 protein [Chloroflexota bacterium]